MNRYTKHSNARAHTTDNKTVLKEKNVTATWKMFQILLLHTESAVFVVVVVSYCADNKKPDNKKVQKKSAMRTTTRAEKKNTTNSYKVKKLFEIIRLNKAEVLLITKDTIVSCSRSFYSLSYFCLRSPKKNQKKKKPHTKF